MKLKKSVKKDWVKALRSGDYKQGKAFLHRDGKFCCLGVLCELAASNIEVNIMKRNLHKNDAVTMYDCNPSIPPLSVLGWALSGLKKDKNKENGEITNKLKVYIDGDYATLVTHNDVGKSFMKIADAIDTQL